MRPHLTLVSNQKGRDAPERGVFLIVSIPTNKADDKILKDLAITEDQLVSRGTRPRITRFDPTPSDARYRVHIFVNRDVANRTREELINATLTNHVRPVRLSSLPALCRLSDLRPEQFVPVFTWRDLSPNENDPQPTTPVWPAGIQQLLKPSSK